MADNTVNASLSIPVDLNGDETPRLMITEHIQVFDGWKLAPMVDFADIVPAIMVRVYPGGGGLAMGGSGSMKVVVSRGTTKDKGLHNDIIVDEPVKFSGGNSASTQYPAKQGTVSVTSIDAAFDKYGNAVSPNFSIGSYGTIKSDVDFYGGVTVSYYASYRMYKYTFGKMSVIPPETGVEAMLYAPGTFFAFYQDQVAVAEFTPRGPTVPSEDKPRIELYKDVSTVIVNKQGLWEKPDGWTGEDDSPTFAAGDPDPTEAYSEDTRVHVVAYLDKYSRVELEEFSHKPGYHDDSITSVQLERVPNEPDENDELYTVLKRGFDRGMAIAPAPRVFQIGGAKYPPTSG